MRRRSPTTLRRRFKATTSDDCRSTWRRCAIGWSSFAPGLAPPCQGRCVREGEANEKVGELEERQRGMREQILKAIPAAASDADHTQHAHWLLAYLI